MSTLAESLLSLTEVEEQTLYLISNIREGDTLSSFGNPVPASFLNPHHYHKIALAGLGFHYQVKNNAVPKDLKYPVLIQIFRKDFLEASGYENPEDVEHPLTLSSLIRNNEGYFIDEDKEYDPEELSKHLNKLAILNHREMKTEPRGFPTKLQNETIHFGQMSFPFKMLPDPRLKRLHETILLYHERFADSLGLLNDSNKLSHLYVESQKYYFLPSNLPITLTSNQKIVIKKPKVLHIFSSNVKVSLVDDSFKPFLKRTAMPNEDTIGKDRYLTFNFKTLEYYPTHESITNSIHIQLLDEHKNQLRLSSGQGSFVIIKIKSSPYPF